MRRAEAFGLAALKRSTKMENTSTSQTPLVRLRSSLKDIGALTVAHFNMIEEQVTLKEWTRDQTSIFTKSGITLLCSLWEAFVEDCARDAAYHLVNNVQSESQLPLHLRKIIAKEIKAEKNDLAPWLLASDGWRAFTIQRLESILDKRLNRMNAPKSSNVKELFADTVGIEDIELCWSWELFESKEAQTWLNKFVGARGAIAHGREPDFKIGAFPLDFFTHFVAELARLTHNKIDVFLQDIGTEPIWEQEVETMDWSLFRIFKQEEVPPELVLIFRPKEIFPAHYAIYTKKDEGVEQSVPPKSDRAGG